MMIQQQFPPPQLLPQHIAFQTSLFGLRSSAGVPLCLLRLSVRPLLPLSALSYVDGAKVDTKRLHGYFSCLQS